MVELLGYCVDDDMQILGYEFDPQCSLHNSLHGPALSWVQRSKIALGVARGLCYIHGKAMVHRGVRSCSVILFDDEISKITYFHQSMECSCKEAYLDERHPLAFPPCLQYHPPE